MPELGLRTRDDLVGLRQLLDVGGTGDQRIVEELHRADLQHVQDHLGVLRIVLVPAVVKGLARPSQPDGGHELEIEPSLAKMMRQRSMIVAGRLEPDPHGQTVVRENGGQALKVVKRVRDGQSAAALLARNANQDLVAMFGNVDSNQQGRRDRMGGGHSRSPQRCGSCKTTVET